MGIDYYGVLSIQRNSTALEIRKAYRNLALEFNPERLKDPSAHQVFSLVGEAYDVLSDALKRAVFDQYGEEGLKMGVPTTTEFIQPYRYHGDPMRTYKDFFGTSSPYADLLDHLPSPPLLYDVPEVGRGIRKKQPPIYHPLCLTLHEAFFGGVKKMKIHRLRFIGDDQIQTQVEEKILSIPIKPGMRPDTEVTFIEEGDQGPSHIPSDIIFVTEDRPHESFQRVGNNLVMIASITLEEALLGTTVTVYTLDHRTVRIPITDVVSPGYEKIVENEGMRILENPEEKGNLIIQFDIRFPEYIPKASKEHLNKAFDLAKIGGGLNQHEMINRMVLADKILRVDPDEQLPPI